MRKEILINDTSLFYEFREEGKKIIVQIDGKDFIFTDVKIDDDQIHFELNDKKSAITFGTKNNNVFCDIGGKAFHAKKVEKNFAKSSVSNGDGLVTPMPGKIIKICSSVGDQVKLGDPVIVMEAMKMEHTLSAPKDGVIKAIHASEGELVDGNFSVVDLGDLSDS